MWLGSPQNKSVLDDIMGPIASFIKILTIYHAWISHSVNRVSKSPFISHLGNGHPPSDYHKLYILKSQLEKKAEKKGMRSTVWFLIQSIYPINNSGYLGFPLWRSKQGWGNRPRLQGNVSICKQEDERYTSHSSPSTRLA